METLLFQKRWRWLGHVLRKSFEDMTKVALRWTPEGKRKRGRPKTTWRRTIENEIKETWDTIERKANNREEWSKLVSKGASFKENHLITTARDALRTTSIFQIPYIGK
jgi:hypothetical protein